MNLRRTTLRMTGRVAAFGAAAALAGGALVAASTTAADAASATGSYDCSALGNPLGSFPMTVDVPLMPPTAPAGMPITPGLLGVTATITVPPQAAGLLSQAGVTGGAVSDFGVTIGSTTATAPLNVDSMTPNADQSVTMVASGVNDAFTLPAAGSYAVMLPTSFTFTPSNASGPMQMPVSCTTAAPEKLSDVTLSKQYSSVTAKAPKTVRKTQHAKVAVAVANEYSHATGKVVAKEGKKALGSATLKSGKATITLPKLKPGKHTITVVYSGDKFTQSGKSSPVKITVKR